MVIARGVASDIDDLGYILLKYKYFKHISRLCHELAVKNHTECNYFHDIAERKIRQIKGTEKLLLEVTDPKYSGKRIRRGVLNFVGEISKILFGTMDNDDAKYYNEQIRHFEENSDSMTNLLKQQLSVVKSTLGAINETLSDMEYNEDVVKRGLSQIKAYVESVISNTTRVTDALADKITVESHIARVNEALNTLQRSLDVVIDSIINARKGILQPQVVPPSLLMDALTRSFPSFPKETMAPFPLSKDSINLLLKICDIHVYLSDGILGYVVELPLVNRGNFKILKMTPIPVALDLNKFLYIDTAESMLCLDQARQYYLMLTEDELRQCKTKDSNSYVCKQKHPLMSSHVHESCYIRLLQANERIPRSCETRIAKLTNTVWVQLMNNEWIYFSPSIDSVTVLCDGKEPADVLLTGVGKLSINSGCKGYSTSALLQTSFTVASNSSVKGGDLLTQVPLRFDCCEELNMRVNLSSIHLDMKFKQIVSHLNDLKYASFKVSDLEKEIQEQEWKNKHISSHMSYSVMVYIIFAIIGMYAFYKLYRYVRNRWLHAGNPRTTTAAMKAITATGSGGMGNTVNINIKTSNESLVASPETIPLRGSTQSLQDETPTRRSLRPRLAKSYF